MADSATNDHWRVSTPIDILHTDLVALPFTNNNRTMIIYENDYSLIIGISMKHSLLLFKLLALALISLDNLSDIRIKAFMLLF